MKKNPIKPVNPADPIKDINKEPDWEKEIVIESSNAHVNVDEEVPASDAPSAAHLGGGSDDSQEKRLEELEKELSDPSETPKTDK
ncbi:MAG: hypothetical protein WCT19_01955 [Candidatus Paceibacterota bacterium]|jgi:hypothetical protein